MSKMLLVNPRRRRRKTAVKRRRNPVARKRRAPVKRRRASTVARRRRNPSARGIINSTVKPAALSAGGALALDVAWNYLPLPDVLKVGPTRYLAKGAGAIALGFLAEKVTTKSNANVLATGAMTVVLHDMAKEFLSMYWPALTMGEYMPGGAYSGSMPVQGAGALGYYSPAIGTGNSDYSGSMGMYLTEPAPPTPVVEGDPTQAMGMIDPYQL